MSSYGSLTDPESVEIALVRPLTPAEQKYINGLCDQASALLRAALPSVDDRLNADELSRDVVATVLADVIARRLLNPQRATTVGGESAGPYSSPSLTFAGERSDSFGNLVITPADVARLSPAAGFAMPGTIRTRSVW